MCSALPGVTVVVPVYDDAVRLRGCVEALLAQDYPYELVEVVVVDNASAEDVRGVLPSHPRLRVLHEARRGSYAARNTGVRAAHGDVLAFTDSDCVPSRAWLTEAVSALHQEPRADMVGGIVQLFFAPGPRSGPALYEAQHAFPQERYVREQGFAVTANMVTWRATMERVGPFDAALQSRGDADWGRRVRATGGTQRYAPGAVVHHPARATWSEHLRKVRRVGEGRRDSDLGSGLGTRSHFLGLAAEQLMASMRTCVSVWRRPHPAGAGDKARYLTAFIAARAELLRVFLRAALAPRTERRDAAVPPSGPVE